MILVLLIIVIAYCYTNQLRLEDHLGLRDHLDGTRSVVAQLASDIPGLNGTRSADSPNSMFTAEGLSRQSRKRRQKAERNNSYCTTMLHNPRKQVAVYHMLQPLTIAAVDICSYIYSYTYVHCTRSTAYY